MNILCVGPTWQGSNAGALFRGFQKSNHVVSIIDENYFLSLSSQDMVGKLVSKLIRGHQVNQLNAAIVNHAKLFRPDFVLIYKGAFVLPQTILELKKLHVPVVNFFPDVSFRVHGHLIPRTLPLYDFIFTTKSFGLADLKQQMNLSNTFFIAHGFDEDLHYPHIYSRERFLSFECEVSFIGDRDLKKQLTLSSIMGRFPNLQLNIWGKPWKDCDDVKLRKAIKGQSIFGDLYPIGIQSSLINLGLLSEARRGASSGDLITSRTFHIPACSGFMIHERTDDVLNFFQEGIEIECFSELTELNDKIDFYLKNVPAREKIRKKGFERCIKDHSLTQRAKQIIQVLVDNKILSSEL